MTDKLRLELIVDDKGGVQVLRKVGEEAEKSGKQGEQAFKKMDASSSSAFSSIAKLAAGYLSFTALKAGFTQTTQAASDLQEVTGKFDVVFKGQEKAAAEMAATLVESYAMSRREAKQYLSSVQDLLVPMGVAPQLAAKLSDEVVKLSADLGSFNNLPTAQVMGDMQSALVGNFETMKKYGVVLNAASVEQKALSMGLVRNKEDLTAAHRAQAAYQLIVQGSTAAIGDMERTSGNYANQNKQLKANIENLSATIGDALLPHANDVVKQMNAWIKANETLIGQKVESAIGDIGRSIENIKRLYDSLPDGVIGAAGVGLIGRMLFGSTPAGVLVGAAWALSGALEKFQSDETKRLAAALTKTPTLAEFQAAMNAQRFSIGPATPGYAAYAAGKSVSAPPPAAPAIVATGLTSKQIADAELQYAKELAARYRDVQNDSWVYRYEGEKETSAKVLATYKAMYKWQDDRTKEAEAQEKKTADDAIRLAADRAAAYRTMYGDLKGKSRDYYDYQDQLLKNERDKYEKLIDDKILADKWYEVQKKKLDQEQMLASDNLFAGIRVGYQRMLDDQKTWAQAGLGIFDSFTKSAESMMSDNFFAVFTGNMDQVRLDWDSMWQSMARSAADHMAKIATETAIDTTIKGMDWLGTALGWWAAGAWEIKKDQLAVLHKGEMVLDPERSARVRSLAGSDPSLGESMPPGGGGYSKGTAGAYVEHAVLSAMLGSAKGFAVNKGIGWAITGKLAMSAIPGGVLASLVNAAYRGVVAYNQAKAMLDAIYGRDVSSNMGWSLRTEADYYGRGLPGDDPMASYGFGRGGVGDDPSAPSGGDFGGGYSGPAGESSSGFWHRGGRFRLRSDEGFFIGARGEEVVTARNLARLEKVIASRSGPSPSPEIRIETKGGGDLVAEIRQLRAELKAANYAIAKNTGISARILDRWDGDGLPAERVV